MICLQRQHKAYRSSIPKCGCAGVILLSLATASRAITIVGQDSTAPAGGTGSFDVDCFGTSEPSWVSAFSLEITVPTDITITSAVIDTADPYIFGSVLSPPFVQSMTSDSVTVADSFSYYLDYTTVSDGDAFGLVHVDYSVAPTAPAGSYSVVYPSDSFTFSYGVIGTVSFPAASTITVTVPEPATLGSGFAGITLLALRRRSRWSRLLSPS